MNRHVLAGRATGLDLCCALASHFHVEGFVIRREVVGDLFRYFIVFDQGESSRSCRE